MEQKNFNDGLQRHLMKCELEYRVKMLPGGSCVDWLEEHCNSLTDIADFLRELGFKIKVIVDDVDCTGERYQWVETTSGIVVHVNVPYSKGLVNGREKRR